MEACALHVFDGVKQKTADAFLYFVSERRISDDSQLLEEPIRTLQTLWLRLFGTVVPIILVSLHSGCSPE